MYRIFKKTRILWAFYTITCPCPNFVSFLYSGFFFILFSYLFLFPIFYILFSLLRGYLFVYISYRFLGLQIEVQKIKKAGIIILHGSHVLYLTSVRNRDAFCAVVIEVIRERWGSWCTKWASPATLTNASVSSFTMRWSDNLFYQLPLLLGKGHICLCTHELLIFPLSNKSQPEGLNKTST